MSIAKAVLLLLTITIATACGPAEDVDSSTEDLGVGVYVSRATNTGNAGYIGDWEHDWGYVLGYLLPGSKIYAQVVRKDSVYGLITNGHYGAWDHGHHCGWVSLKHLHGRGFHSTTGNICPPPDNDFSLAPQTPEPTGFRHGSWVHCDGCVQRAVVLPTCSDFTVYANYDPVTHTFHDPDGTEVAQRGTIDGAGAYSLNGLKVTAGYSGFGTRFVTSDDVAVEIKDTKRACTLRGGCTPFGFMHADCIGGEQVGAVAGHGPTPPPTAPTGCGDVIAPQGIVTGEFFTSCNGRFKATLQGDGNFVLRDQSQSDRAIWATNTSGTSAFSVGFLADGNLVVYGHDLNILWTSNTAGQGGTRLAFQDDGNVVIYTASSTAIWQTGTAGQ